MSQVGDPPPAYGNGPQAIMGGSGIARPDFYNGDRGQLERWLQQLDVYFRFDGRNMPPNQRGLFATTYLRGAAEEWSKPMVRKYLEEPEDNEEIVAWIENHERFKEKLRSIFGISNDKELAIRAIQRLTQKRSTAEYAAEFQKHAVVTEWDDDVLMTMYRRGLKDGVLDKLEFTGVQIEDLDALVKETIEIDDKLYKRYTEKKEKENYRQYTGPTYQSHNQGRSNQERRNYHHDPMELDVIDQRNRQQEGRGRKDNQKGRKNIKCYECGKLGHIARNCRSRVQTMQLNVMERTVTDLPDINNSSSGWVILADESDNEESTEHDYEIEPTYYDLEKTRQAPEEWNELTKDAGDNLIQEWEGVTNALQYLEQASVEQAMRTLEEQTSEKPLPVPQGATQPGPEKHYLDPRNHQHGQMHFSACYTDECWTHRSDKCGSGWYPKRPRRDNCRANHWSLCEKNNCPVHLWDKRANCTFPGQRFKWVQHDDEWEQCPMNHWIYCLWELCQEHKQDKIKNGYLPTVMTKNESHLL